MTARRLAWTPLLGWLVPAPAPASPAILIAQVLVGEDQVTVVSRLDVAGDPRDAAGAFPLLLPEDGPGPVLAPRSEAVPDGVEVQTSGPVRASFGPEGLRIAPAGGPGNARVEVRYTLPVRSAEMPLVLAPERTLDRVRLVTRRTGAYAPQMRPLAPYAYEEEDDDDGTWQMLTLRDPVRAGTRLRVSLGHLPAPFGPYRTAALVGLVAVVVGVGLASLGRGRGGSAICGVAPMAERLQRSRRGG